MRLTETEKRMLAGDEGEAVRLSMELVTRIGEAYGAARLVEVKSVHAGAGYPHLVAGVETVEKFAGLDGKFRVPTTVNPRPPRNFDPWGEHPEPQELKSNVARVVAAIEKMGIIPNWSCIPYFQGNLPRFGECVSWGESSAVSFANSVLGARTNRTTPGVNIAVAITGRAPEFGLLLEANRAGNALVVMEYQPRTLFDYGAVGYVIGKAFGDKVPVIENLPQGTTANQLKVMGAVAASRGIVALYHAVGLTPEARTRRQAFRGTKPKDEMKIGEKEIKAAIEELNTIKSGPIDAVLVGCPHPLVEEIEELARLLRGKKVHKNIKFCLFASSDVIGWSHSAGLVDIIKGAGVTIFEGGCILPYPVKSWGWKNVATDSAKYANILPSDPTYVEVLYTDLKRCVDIATA